MDELFMKRCLELAKLGFGQVAPNPMVGCVIVHNDKIIGEGFHERFGDAHAELNAIKSVSDSSLLEKSTLYVNLEPCTHMGKTPACADTILSSHIPRVVLGVMDPNKKVKGGGLQYLEQNGCTVLSGVLEEECADMNRRFLMFHRRKRPYVILKWAESRDGFMAPVDSSQQWITGDESKKLVHKWRTQEQAIMVGTNTAIIDNPQLTARLWEGNNPIRITIDNHMRIPLNSKLFDGEAETLVYGPQREGGNPNVKYADPNELNAILADLHQRDILSVIVEGGAQLLNSFIELGLWDEARVFTGNIDFSDGIKAPGLEIDSVDKERVGLDELSLYRNRF
ncbi:MAG: bifunctional diaminohydroxyphosphoribosylaminopyrimidine deaminase/5-amino-6-(5-phosphoribosylamino)uracil reductase RibD [Flavobacteriales bacterium]|nr:bifunctional diaminohydroxyphosphoribosylaminopyrimidine deaminase/5-amino-6-(5-phosphoribosylamino)uracil reductase RibD [Flavobacteriales bacterium]